MTGKVQKILSEIATRKLCTMDEHMAFYNDKAKEDYRFLSEIEEIVKGMKEEPVSEDLKKEIHKEIVKLHTSPCYDELKAFALHFIEWQKGQMMKDAIEVDVMGYGTGWLSLGYLPECEYDFKEGDKVKIIIVKEN